VAGIALQGWERHGWRAPWPQPYWFWRDRKGLAGNLLSPVANVLFLFCLVRFLACAATGHSWRIDAGVPPWLTALCQTTLALSVSQMAMRMWASARIYGWIFAAGVPVRMVWANLVNGVATLEALRQFFFWRMQSRALVWRKTEHDYPETAPGCEPVTFGD
jgi:adsorption protein B